MVRGVIHRIAVAAGAIAATAALMLTVTPAAAAAAPPAAGVPAAPRKAAKPDAVTITGGKAPKGLTVRAEQNAELFASLFGQVSWLAEATPQMNAPKRDKLGDRYTLVVLARNAPQQRYDVYPHATGGPKAYRPAKQPKGKVQAGWFYGRLSMPETLRMSGVPLPEDTSLITGGVGGGERASAPYVIDTNHDIAQFVGDMRQLVLLNGAVVLTIAIGLAGMSYLIRRKI